MVMHWSKCRGTGHNARKCPNPAFIPTKPVLENATRGRGTRGRGRGQQGGRNQGGRGNPMNSQVDANRPKFPRVENRGIGTSADLVGTQPTEIYATQGPTTQPQSDVVDVYKYNNSQLRRISCRLHFSAS